MWWSGLWTGRRGSRRGGRTPRDGRRIGEVAPWWSGCLLALAGAGCLVGGQHLPVTVALAADAVPDPGAGSAASPSSGLVTAAVVGAAVLVALWRVVLRLLLVAVVALGLIGLIVVLDPGVARADESVPSVGPSSGSGSLPVIAVLVVLAAVFVVGLLLGEQWHRRQIVRRERQLAQAQRELAALTRQRDAHRPS